MIHTSCEEVNQAIYKLGHLDKLPQQFAVSHAILAYPILTLLNQFSQIVLSTDLGSSLACKACIAECLTPTISSLHIVDFLQSRIKLIS